MGILKIEFTGLDTDTVEPSLSGHPQGDGKWPLNKGHKLVLCVLQSNFIWRQSRVNSPFYGSVRPKGGRARLIEVAA